MLQMPEGSVSCFAAVGVLGICLAKPVNNLQQSKGV